MPVKFDRTDLDFILKQILMAEAGQPPVNPHLPFGLRQVAGTNNNLLSGQGTFGAADQTFPTTTTQYFQTVTVNVDGTPFDPNPGVAGDTITTTYASTTPGAVFGVNVIDGAPRTISNLISDLSVNNPAAVQAAQGFGAQLGDGYTVFSSNPGGLTLPGPDGVFGTADDVLPADPNNLFIGNITPDAGLSAPFNNWMTFFGQFFDHGLDLITKGGSGTVYIPLAPDDPLYVAGSPTNFMVLTRATNATVLPGPDGVLGTSDDIHKAINTTTPFVDQNQTYSSHPSHQVFLREYQLGVDGIMHSTGSLLRHAAGYDGVLGTADDNKGEATWADVKANALKLGIILTDADVVDVPLLATDAYGNFTVNPLTGALQFVVSLGGGAFGLVDAGNINPAAGPLTAVAVPANVVRTGHAFINDMAFGASPFSQSGAALVADADAVAGGAPPAAGQYDNELLDSHYIAGDGRANENIALTAVHAIFHDEHNRLVEQTKQLVRDELAKGDTSFALNWVLAGANLADGIQDNEWNGERLFQAAKFGTETQYQHLVFEEFARKISPTIHLFGNVDIHLDPAITSEFANAVYRFGHSMLDENVPLFQLNADGTMAVGANGQPLLTNAGLIQAFTNPLAFAALGATGAAQIVQGTTHQIGSEIDEFVTGALRNNLLGLPLDLAALNIARGRDTGVAPLNLVRAQIFAATNDQTLKPYANWDEFRQFLKHDASIINFIAAYGTHASIQAATTLADKRAAAIALVTVGVNPLSATGTAAERDAYNFMHSLGVYANDVANPLAVHAQWSTGSVTGVDNIDLWIGGLAEKQNLFGGLLGSTFNFIFETQLESLQDGDRLYYLPRIEGLHWGSEIEGNTFASMIMANTGARHLPASIFLTPEYTVESRTVTADPATWLRNPVTGAYLVTHLTDAFVQQLIAAYPSIRYNDGVHVGFDTQVHFLGDDNFFGNTMVLGGTEGRDVLIAGHADDDTVWGDGGDDFIDGGNGNDQLFGGTGNDTFVDSGGNDIIHGDEGDDSVFAGIGDDIVFGGDGNDYLEGGAGIDALSGGLGNDIMRGGEDDDELVGNEGDDWIEGGGGGDLIVGDQGAPTGDVPWISGNDVLDGGVNGDRMQGFSGDDIMLGQGGFDKFEGRLGYDWASFEYETSGGVSVDMNRREFIADPRAPGGDAIRDFFIETEGFSGTRFDDIVFGTNANVLDPQFNELTNVDLITGLASFFPVGPVAYSGGNILLGGDGSDTFIGRGGNDIIDGDARLHVALSGPGAGATIIREIIFDTTPGDVDTAVFNDVIANYAINLVPDAQGFITVTHINVSPGIVGLVNEGTDRLRNIERIQFADVTIIVDANPGANQLPTGSITIAGDTNAANPGVDPRVGSPLAGISTVGDPDGITPGTLTYEWQYLTVARPVWTAIAGSNAPTFTPTTFVEGDQLRLSISYIDGLGHRETVVSAATNTVAGAAGNTAPFVVAQQGLVGIPDTTARTGLPVNLFLPLTTAFGDAQTPSNLLTYTVSLVRADGTLQALDGSAAASGLTYATLFDATGLLVTSGNVTGVVSTAGPITLRVRATDGGGLSVTDDFVINVLQGNRAPIVAAAAEVFAGLEDISISGTLLAGTDPDGTTPVFRLVAGSGVNGTVTSFNQTTGAFTFLGAPNFAGPASFSYTLFDGQLSSAVKTVTVNVAPVDDGPAPVTLTGTAAVGQLLTAVIGVDPDGPWNSLTATYQWFRDGVAIGPATSSPDYAVTAADVGHAISAVAVYTDGQGFVDTAASAPTAPVGLLAVRALEGVATATVTVFNSITDPDGNPTPDGTFYDWEVSIDGINWTPASPPAATVSADGLSLTLANNTVRFVRTTVLYVDGAGNLNVATSEAARVSVGTTGGNSLTGIAGADIFFGLAGVDTINTAGGNDIIVGGTGNDILNGGAGDDTFIYRMGDGADAVNGSTGTDLLSITGAGAANETLNVIFNGTRLTGFENGTLTAIEQVRADLLAGTDTLTYTSTSTAAAVNVNLAAGTASGFTSIAGIENVNGSIGNDTIVGSDANNVLNGDDGNDILTGRGGVDIVNGGIGNDRFVATIGDGNDTYNGAAGTDTLDLSALTLGATVNLSATASTVGGVTTASLRAVGAQIGTDVLSSIENVIGGAGDDRIIASSDRNVFTGGGGADTFAFRTAGAASNGFNTPASIAANRDIVVDFASGTDKIDFRGIDADTRAVVAAAGFQSFIWDGLVANAAAVTAGHMGYHYETIGGVQYTVIDANIRTANVDTTLDFQVALQGHLTPTALDIIFGP